MQVQVKVQVRNAGIGVDINISTLWNSFTLLGQRIEFEVDG